MSTGLRFLQLGLGLAGSFTQPWNPADLFTNNTPGVYFDDDDLSTFFQDAAGTIPGAWGAPVGLQLDKSRRLALGAELLLDPTIDNPSKWVETAGLAVAGGVATFTAAGSGTILQVLPVERPALLAGTWVKYSITVQSITLGALAARAGGGAAATGPNITTPGTHTGYLWTDTTGTTQLGVRAVGTTTAVVSAASFKVLSSSPRYQTTSGDRPMLGRLPNIPRVNLFNYTGFAGAVAGTPGTPPSNWGFVASGGTINAIAGDGSLSFSATASRHFINQGVNIDANQNYSASIVVASNTGLVATQIIAVGAVPSGATTQQFANGSPVNFLTYVPVPGEVLEIRIANSSTAGSFIARVGAGTSSNVTGTVAIKEPQLRVGTSRGTYQPVYGAEYTPRRNLLINTEFPNGVTGMLSGGGVAATTMIGPGGAVMSAIQLNLNAAISYVYNVSYTAPFSTMQTISFFIRMDDGLAPTLGSATPNVAANDFYINAGSSIPGPLTYVVEDFGGGLYRVSGSALSHASGGTNFWGPVKGTGNSARGFKVTGLQVTRDSTPTPYQRVGTSAYDVTESGIESVGYVEFNGLNHWLQTNAVDFTSTDKATVFAAARRGVDGVSAMLVELSAASNSNNGSFQMRAPHYSGGTYPWAFFAMGSTLVAPVAGLGSMLSPNSAVLTGKMDISGDATELRVNGSSFASASVDHGSGNMGNYALFYGRRGGSSLPFTGREYGKNAVVGRWAANDEVTRTEALNLARRGAFA